jgi:hypothetical protein
MRSLSSSKPSDRDGHRVSWFVNLKRFEPCLLQPATGSTQQNQTGLRCPSARPNSEMLVYFEVEEALDRIVVENVPTEEERIYRERRTGVKDVVDSKNKLGVVE